MTTMFKEDVKCCVCGQKSSQMGIGSTNLCGSPDLDTRPPEMQRSTIYHWIQRCSSCGYCSSNLSKCNPNTRKMVESKEYQDIIENKAIPEVAASFLALSYEKQQTHQYSDSAWQAIHAAWICDDKDNYEASQKCRKQALSIIEMGKAQSQPIVKQAGATEAITIDLMRRAGMFQQALELVEETKIKDFGEIITPIIRYQETLINLKDVKSHTISEAIPDK